MPIKQSGFTLIELLITVVILAILSGILISVINPSNARNKAKDGVRAGTLAKLAQAVEAYTAGESALPADESVLIAATSQYVQSWPADSDYASGDSRNYRYRLNTASGTQHACVSVAMATASSPQLYFKYVNFYNVASMGGSFGTQSPVGRILRNCTTSCVGSVSLSGCAII